MSMQIDTGRLTMFRNVDFGNENAIANVNDGKTKLVKNSELGNLFGRLFRSGATEARNNAARTALLKSLGEAFGLGGMSESDGTIRFSKDFIAKLEEILGRDVLKTGDFKIRADGTVASGRPLTQRRINAIVNKAVLVGQGVYNYEDYKAKLDYVRNRLDAMQSGSGSRGVAGAREKFVLVEKMMTFVKDELPRLIDDNDDYLYSEEGAPFAMRQVKDGVPKMLPLESLGMVNIYVSQKIGAPFHLAENVIRTNKISVRLDELDDPKTQIPGYFDRVMKSYVTTAIDLFIECERLGKLDDYIAELNDNSICVEAKTSSLVDFRLRAIPPEGGPVATHNNDQPLDQCIGREMAAMIEKNPKLQESDDFNDFAAEIKKNLVGTIRPITEAYQSPGGIRFRPVLDGKGKPVVRAITKEDIDRIGQACVDVTFGM